MDVAGVMLVLIACLALVELLAMAGAWFLKQTFDWNPLGTRRPHSTPPRPGREKTGDPEGRTWEKTPVNRWESTESKRESVTTL
ncbi:hypothetical protein BW12_06950 [Bifidobacterium sp. UTCIF-3]|nr:hypothetical protein BW09_04795 [Bifidobacterium sp. UTCIF-1]TPF81206.1 hypothetical protein BW08_00785 [Bifidobacterium sp. UTCIF-24]TPF81986.1 hypothetical protein BW12_06950 [Bifidobacterium sp. UTCIF-3]TPF85166.1 hypothetical protein BW07_00400 [Bifidobacterium sp. UTCIF-36]